MSDRITRVLERQAGSGDLQVDAALIRERLRVMEVWCPCDCPQVILDGTEPWSSCAQCQGTGRVRLIPKERLEIATYCGSPGARMMLAGAKTSEGGWLLNTLQRCPHDPSTTKTTCSYPCINHDCFAHWLSGLSRWPGTLLRGAIAATEVAFQCWRQRFGRYCYEGHRTLFAEEQAVLDAINAAKRFRDDWTAENRETCGQTQVLTDNGTFGLLAVERDRWWANVVIGIANNRPTYYESGILHAALLTSEDKVRTAIQTELVGWVLGT